MERQKTIEMIDISKSFGSVQANQDVFFDVYEGEVHAILGENGAGKSTLMNMLSGIYRPDGGTIHIYGEPARLTSPKEAIRLGIGMIYQHFNLIDVMTAAENIAIGQPSKLFLRRKALSQSVRDLSDRYGLDIDPDKRVADMSVGEKQTLEILKVLYRGARILIMDEPTAVLTPQEIRKLFRIIRNMKQQGCSVIIITHKLNEVMEISDRVTVLRKGTSVGTVQTADVDIPNLIEMMVGKKIDLAITKPEIDKGLQTSLLKMDEVTVRDAEGKKALSDVSFDLRKYEILGVAGVANSGQKELCEAIAGLIRPERGRIFFEGENLVGKTPRDIIQRGIRMGFIPEDRLGMGLVGSMDIVSNIILKDYQSQPGIFIRKESCTEKAKRIVETLDIMTPGIDTPVQQLSGGNIQKVLLGREIDSAPKVLITAYAVRGLDIGASFKIYDMLNEQKENGVGVLFVGEDLDVLMDLCDRILVLCHGEVTGIVDPGNVTKEEIGLLMTGRKKETEVSAQ